MKNSLKLVSLLLVAILLFSLLPTVLAAKSETPTLTVLPTETEDLPDGSKNYGRVSEVITDAAKPSSPKRSDPLPTRYDSRDYGYVTPVRNQGAYGTCWAHGAIACIESNMLKKGLRIKGTPVTASTLDLSESQLAWFTYTDAYDALGMLTGDKVTISGSYLQQGGSGQLAGLSLMRWTGAASESEPDLAYSNVSEDGLDACYAYAYDVAHVQSVTAIPASDLDAVKRAIMEYGAGTIAYYFYQNESTLDTPYENLQTGGYYCPGVNGTNHDVTVVGWDDSYSRENFNAGYRPEHDGAWIVKNSWGSYNSLGGYFYLSYENPASSSHDCYFYDVEPADNYDYNYQYDGTVMSYYATTLQPGGSVGNIFTANGDELLEAVSICHLTGAFDYKVQIYTGVRDSTTANPSSGTLAYEQTGSFPYPGYQTVKLDTPVQLKAGERFSVVFVTEDKVRINIDYTDGNYTHVHHPYSSYAKQQPSGYWGEMPSGSNLRIKAYTSDPPSGCEHLYTELRNTIAASCTMPGCEGDTYCTDCGKLVAAGAVIPALGHDLTVSPAVPATCTESGLTQGEACSRCDYEVLPQTVPALGHSYVGGICERCGAAQEFCAHSFSGVRCIHCGAVYRIRSVSLRLSDNINMIFKAEIPEDLHDPYIVFTLNGNETIIRGDTPDNGIYSFEFPDIAPQYMGDSICSVLHATGPDGTEYTYVLSSYRLSTYCVNMMVSRPTDEKLIRLLSDLIAYGTAAQLYEGYHVEHLVMEDLTTYDPSTFPGLSGKAVNFEGTVDPGYLWTDASAVLKNCIGIRVYFRAESLDGLQVQCRIGDRTTTCLSGMIQSDGNGGYYIDFRDIQATEFDSPVTFKLLRNGVQVGQTLTYSVNTYVCNMQNSMIPGLADLVQAIYNYGVSAKAYAAG